MGKHATAGRASSVWPDFYASSLLVQRLLFNRFVGGEPRAVPVVVLLGPAGAGKTEALNSLSRDCGSGVVHALYDFERGESVGAADRTVAVLADIAFDLSRGWTARRPARFTRFTLGLIAVQAELIGRGREDAREKLRALIDDFARNSRVERLIGLVDPLADAAARASVLTAPLAETVKKVLPMLVRTITRKPLGVAKRWHADIPGAEGSSPLDALIRLNREAHDQPGEMVEWLMAAFLADVRENHLRMAVPDAGSVCSCPHVGTRKHWHNWVLMLDNIDHPDGARFVSALLTGREQHLRQRPDDHDPLLVIATSGRWHDEWESDWRPPWKTAPAEPDGTHTVPSCRKADYQHWAASASPDGLCPRHYPVLLEPLDVRETARMIGTGQFTESCKLVQRATAGLPAAVELLCELLKDQKLGAGVRGLLAAGEGAPSEGGPWQGRLQDAMLNRYLPEIDITEFVSAAPFATAPWLVPQDSSSLTGQPHVSRILTELRTMLWVTVPENVGGTPDQVELHPWIARTLTTALACRPPGTGYTYAEQFRALLADPDTSQDETRTAYCRMALAEVSEVVDYFERTFDNCPHQEWINRLRLVTRAPDELPLDQNAEPLYTTLVAQDSANGADRTRTRNTITRLVVASWLTANPFVVADPTITGTVAQSYRELVPLSRRSDVAALHRAAQLATGPLL